MHQSRDAGDSYTKGFTTCTAGTKLPVYLQTKTPCTLCTLQKQRRGAIWGAQDSTACMSNRQHLKTLHTRWEQICCCFLSAHRSMPVHPSLAPDKLIESAHHCKQVIFPGIQARKRWSLIPKNRADDQNHFPLKTIMHFPVTANHFHTETLTHLP